MASFQQVEAQDLSPRDNLLATICRHGHAHGTPAATCKGPTTADMLPVCTRAQPQNTNSNTASSVLQWIGTITGYTQPQGKQHTAIKVLQQSRHRWCRHNPAQDINQQPQGRRLTTTASLPLPAPAGILAMPVVPCVRAAAGVTGARAGISWFMNAMPSPTVSSTLGWKTMFRRCERG